MSMGFQFDTWLLCFYVGIKRDKKNCVVTAITAILPESLKKF